MKTPKPPEVDPVEAWVTAHITEDAHRVVWLDSPRLVLERRHEKSTRGEEFWRDVFRRALRDFDAEMAQRFIVGNVLVKITIKRSRALSKAPARRKGGRR